MNDLHLLRRDTAATMWHVPPIRVVISRQSAHFGNSFPTSMSPGIPSISGSRPPKPREIRPKLEPDEGPHTIGLALILETRGRSMPEKKIPKNSTAKRTPEVIGNTDFPQESTAQKEALGTPEKPRVGPFSHPAAYLTRGSVRESRHGRGIRSRAIQ
jgi:hypothetical protein